MKWSIIAVACLTMMLGDVPLDAAAPVVAESADDQDEDDDVVREAPPVLGSGHLFEWRGWSFRWHLREREGLVLTEVKFHGRDVLGYAGLAEVFVPYDRGSPRYHDVGGESGMGGDNLVELRPGLDCGPANWCCMFNADGVEEGRRLVGIHEEDTGIRYMDERRRAYGHMLVVWASSQLGFYNYIVRWCFHDDGVLVPQVGLTGQLNERDEGEEHSARSDAYGSYVGPNGDNEAVYALSHVHSLYFRLDFNIDGAENDMVEEYSRTVGVRTTSARNAWTPIKNETVRELDSSSFRRWRVTDARSRNALGHRRSYELVPGGMGSFRGAADETFSHGQLWVTRAHSNEFPVSVADDRRLSRALPTYLNDEVVKGTDLVVWYAMTAQHLPRTEEWPYMPVHWEEFALVPRDFLDGCAIEVE